MADKLTARECAQCGKQRGCFSHVIAVRLGVLGADGHAARFEGQMKAVFLHLRCVRPFIKRYGTTEGGTR